jgi:hypothetical protein
MLAVRRGGGSMRQSRMPGPLKVARTGPFGGGSGSLSPADKAAEKALHHLLQRTRASRVIAGAAGLLTLIAYQIPLREPPINRSEKLAGRLPLALIAPEPRHAHCGAEFPGFGVLLRRGLRARNRNAPALSPHRAGGGTNNAVPKAKRFWFNRHAADGIGSTCKAIELVC